MPNNKYMSKRILVTSIAFLLWACTLSREAIRNAQDRTETQVRAFLKVSYPDTADHMIIKYNSENDTWEFFYVSKANCIDCNFSGSITDDKKKPRIIAVVMDG
jgi:predicted carbohydrate-binding protein with CBM5 and CBM33 domain